MKFLRVWLCGIFVFGMYMFQSTFAYYMKDELTEIGVSVGIVTILGGFRSYGLKFLIANPIGRWADKWSFYILGLIIILLIGMLTCCLYVAIPGWGDAWFNYVASKIGELPNNSHVVDGNRNYSLQGIQILLIIAIGCVLVGLIAGAITYILNKKELKVLNKNSFRWRELGNI